MTSRFRSAQGLLLALAILLLPVAWHAEAQRPRTPAELDTLREEISKLRGKLKGIRRQARTAEEELEAIQLELAIRQGEASIAVEMQARLDGERVRLEQQIATLGSRIAVQKKYLGRRIAALYRLGSLSYLRILLSLDPRGNPLEAASMLTYVVSRDARSVTRYQEAGRVLALRRAELTVKQAAVARARNEVERRLQAVEQSQREKEALLARLRSENAASTRRLAELEEKARRLENLFSLLYERHDPSGLSGARIDDFQGALEWPVAGRVLEEFGPHRNPKFATVTTSNGLKIESQSGTPVRAVFQGTVLFSQWFKGYGNLVILDHGNRIFSLYGNTQNPRVSVGDRVTPRQVIANVGEGEEESAAYLYFEIREDNKPADPRKWLR